MKNGFVRVAAATPDIIVADPEANAKKIVDIILQEESKNTGVLVFPELCLTGYTCQDLFLQDTLLKAAMSQLLFICEETKSTNVLSFVGLPVVKDGRLYNVAAVLNQGRILAFIPKSFIPNYSEFYEARYFAPAPVENTTFMHPMIGYPVPMGTKLIFRSRQINELTVAAELCEDLWTPVPPSCGHAMAGALILCNLSASDENTGKDYYRRELVKSQSARLLSAYIYADAGEGESTQDLVFTGHNIIAENGSVLNESKRFMNEVISTEIDLNKLLSERRRISTYSLQEENKLGYEEIGFATKVVYELPLTRFVDPMPFVPSDEKERDKRCDEILNLQAYGLKKRLAHTNIKHAVIALSGGLDSTLALLVTCRAFDLLNIPRENLVTVTMPCFGTTDRTYQNAVNLAKYLHVTLKEIPLKDAVLLHFKQIEHDPEVHDVTYENVQARERTQVIMDIANQINGLVIGTGDMSELALGWATYNGDHMSMYGVNVSVPKTLVRYLVHYYAYTVNNEQLKVVLEDILDTPVSPELLPPENGKIAQKTEDIVGPYELHDFFLYYVMRFGFAPSKIRRLAVYAFNGRYNEEVINQWLHTFYRRFFAQHFKRSCLPDGPKVGSVALSPRGDLRMPSDASVHCWMKELDEI